MSFKLPQFTNIDIDNFSINLDELLKNNLETIDNLLAENSVYTWDNLMLPLEEIDDHLSKFWAPVSHLHAVVNSPELRACYEACLPKFSAYEAKVSYNKRLYEAIKSIDFSTLNDVQIKIIQDDIRNFELAGVALSDEQKVRFEQIQLQLSELGNRFENNVLDAGLSFKLHVKDEAKLAGLPEHTLHHARALAEDKELEGYILNLEIPCYVAVMTHADDRQIREKIYNAYVTRASDEGPNKGEFDNSKVMELILALRHEKANILGFKNYAELSVATKMVNSCDEVMKFLHDLTDKAYPQALEEMNSLRSFAKERYQITELAPWDIAYMSEKKREMEHEISEEKIRAFFPVSKVLDGLFMTIKTLFGVTLNAIENSDVWHKDIKCYELYDINNKAIGYIYMDLFARPHKRGGAWMDSCQSRRKLANNVIQLPIAMLTCNFSKPQANKTATLSHDEVITLFHEMGHCLHHLLTKVDYLSASGINGVEWDAVELPSQFLENWCWEQEALGYLTSHVETGEIISNELFQKMTAAKNFQSAMGMLRQLEFSLFDFRIHKEYEAKRTDFIAHILADVRSQCTVVPLVPYNRFQHSFSHIFAGGYAAGYYSYKWAEVLSSDAFSRFEDEGIFNQKTGADFLQSILEVGSSKKASEAYCNFRGRPANINALLRHNGIKIN